MNSNYWFSVLRIVIVLLVGLGGMLIWQLILRGVKRRLKESDASGERLQRLTTLTNAGQSIGHALIFLIVVLMILHELSINITPILASAGVVGLAFSLGAQTVIKDYLGGILILIEDQFTIGDVIAVGQFSGVVERITLRATYLRDIEGKLNLIPNGDIRAVSNMTTQWAQVVVTFTWIMKRTWTAPCIRWKRPPASFNRTMKLPPTSSKRPTLLGGVDLRIGLCKCN